MAKAKPSASTEAARSCFQCGLNPRLEGDFMCRSCKEEHPMCYECGQRRRNIPFKLCSKCYDDQRKQGQRMPLLDSSGPGSGDDDSLTANNTASSPFNNDSSILHWLEKDQNTYKEIAEHFKKTWVKFTSSVKKPPEPCAIFAIQNKDIERKYRQYGSNIRKTGRGSNSDLFYHGTKLLCDLMTCRKCCSDSECGICGISQKGFDMDRVATNIPRFQRFGKGIYLAPNSSKCHDYTQGDEDYGMRAQLLCLVAQGARCELMYDNTKLVEAPDGADSVYGKKGGSLNYDEIVVFDSVAIWPQYIIVYEHDGVDKIAK